MATYMAFCKWTLKGAQEVKESPARLDAARKGFERLGVQLKQFFLVTGRYDFIAVIEAPDDAALAKALLMVGAQGNTITETVRAFSEEEYRGICASLP